MARVELRRFLDDLVERGDVTGLTAGVADAAGVRWTASAGMATARPARAAARSTRWDVASLTKPVVATLALVLDGRRLLPLEARVGDVFQSAAPAMRAIRLESLLRHRSSLRAWAPLAALCRRRSDAVDLLLSGGLCTELGRRVVYSDLGYMLWGWCAERALGEPLADLLARHVLRPLGMRGTGASPGERPRVAESRLDNARERQLAAAQKKNLPRNDRPPRGRPQDGNARFLGRLAGHAGLFATLDDLVRLGQEWVRPTRILTAADVERALSGGGEYALGWARRRVRGSAGSALSRSAFGHTGFTGTSLWIDPEADRIFALLAHRTAANEDFNAKRREFHRLAMALFSPT